MSSQSPYEQLGVESDASFDEIQEAKNRLIQQYQGNQPTLEMIEAAYDAIIMERLRMRQEGRIKVPDVIRFPEKTLEAVEPSFSFPANKSSQWLNNLWDKPNPKELLWTSSTFLVLTGAVVFSPAGGSLLSLAIAIGFGASIYLINRKENKFGRAVTLTLAGLLVGLTVGSFLGTAIASQIAVLSLRPDEFASIFTFLVLWLISSFCR
jgi:hypothetical protein